MAGNRPSKRNLYPVTLTICGLLVLVAMAMVAGFWLLWTSLARAVPMSDLVEPWRVILLICATLLSILFYLVFRIRMVDRALFVLRHNGPGSLDPNLRWQAARAMSVSPVFLIAPFAAGLVITSWMFVSRAGFSASFVSTAGVVTVLLIPFLSGGLITSMITRWILRPAWRELSFRRPPASLRFGVVHRMIFQLLLMAQVGVAAVVWLDCRGSGLLLRQAEHSIAVLGAPPMSSFWGVALIIVFAALTGWLITSGFARRMVALAARFDAMGQVGKVSRVDPLPVHSNTETGSIALAFNRLLVAQNMVQQRLAEYTEKVGQTERLRTRFLRHASHELRTPLNSIIGFSDLMLQGVGGQMNSGQLEAAQAINSSGERLLGLINDILLMAQFDADRVVDSRESLSVEALWGTISQELELTGGARAELSAEPEVRKTQVEVDVRMWGRALAAMVEVGHEHQPQAGVRLRVELTSDGRLLWWVPVARSFCQMSDPESLFTGFGLLSTGVVRLGLALSRRIVRLHGGQVEMRFLDGQCRMELWLDLESSSSRGEL